jgi:CheY-like chemotaxis protein
MELRRRLLLNWLQAKQLYIGAKEMEKAESAPLPKAGPKTRRAKPVRKAEHPDARPGTNGAKKILVVDDDPTTIKIISHFLQKESYEVSSSLSGVEGLKKAFQEGPDLILLDVMMPDLNGFQFLSIYRKVGENARTPVLILSSLSEEADILKGLEIGAVDYITKPFSPQLLMAKIKKSLNSRP